MTSDSFTGATCWAIGSPNTPLKKQGHEKVSHSNDSQVAHVMRNKAEHWRTTDSKEALTHRINRRMAAMTFRIASSNTSGKPEQEFQSIKAKMTIMKTAIREALHERSQIQELPLGKKQKLQRTITTCYGSNGTTGWERQSGEILRGWAKDLLPIGDRREKPSSGSPVYHADPNTRK